MDGKGTLTWTDGRSYKGEFKNDLKHGYGIFEWSDGRIYDGQWNKGKFHGKGKLIKDGQVRFAEWQNGKRTKWLT